MSRSIAIIVYGIFKYRVIKQFQSSDKVNIRKSINQQALPNINFINPVQQYQHTTPLVTVSMDQNNYNFIKKSRLLINKPNLLQQRNPLSYNNPTTPSHASEPVSDIRQQILDAVRAKTMKRQTQSQYSPHLHKQYHLSKRASQDKQNNSGRSATPQGQTRNKTKKVKQEKTPTKPSIRIVPKSSKDHLIARSRKLCPQTSIQQMTDKNLDYKYFDPETQPSSSKKPIDFQDNQFVVVSAFDWDAQQVGRKTDKERRAVDSLCEFSCDEVANNNMDQYLLSGWTSSLPIKRAQKLESRQGDKKYPRRNRNNYTSMRRESSYSNSQTPSNQYQQYHERRGYAKQQGKCFRNRANQNLEQKFLQRFCQRTLEQETNSEKSSHSILRMKSQNQSKPNSHRPKNNEQSVDLASMLGLETIFMKTGNLMRKKYEVGRQTVINNLRTLNSRKKNRSNSGFCV